MSSVFKQPEVRPNLGRNGFDMSQRRIYSCPAGMLLPVYKDFANPGDKYKINSNAFIRTEAVETAAFMRLKYHLDWFFVPITQIYRFWGEFFYGTDDVMTTFGENLNKSSLPTCSIYNSLYPESNPFWTFQKDSRDYLDVDEFGIPKLWNAVRLMDMLEYGSLTNNFSLQNSTSSKDLWFPLYYLVYHKIFHSHYLNTQYFKNVPIEFNVDAYSGTSIPQVNVNLILSHIHYRPYRKDYFTSQQPSPVFNDSWANSIRDSLSIPNPGIVAPDSLTETSIVYRNNNNDSNNYIGSSVLPSVSTSSGLDTDTAFSVSVGQLRSLFALDRLFRVTASTGSHYADQTLAHFGQKLPVGIKDEAYFLGSQTTDIIINEVVASASTDPSLAGGTIGDIAGKGFGSTPGQDDINFECPCHGVIMGISSIEPLADYASNRPDIVNRYLNSYDFYHPELDNLGMQPLWDPTAFFNYIGDGNSNVPAPVGWQPRHMELKTKYDVVNESMFATHRSSWVGFKQSMYDPVALGTIERPSANINLFFYIAPQYTNNIFLGKVPYYNKTSNSLSYGSTSAELNFKDPNLQVNKIYASDNFLVNLQMNVYKTSCMSVHSLPKYI